MLKTFRISAILVLIILVFAMCFSVLSYADTDTDIPTKEDLIEIATQVLYYQSMVNKAAYGDLCGFTDVDLTQSPFYAWALNHGYILENSSPVRESVEVKNETGEVLFVREGAVAFPESVSLDSLLSDTAKVMSGDLLGWRTVTNDGSSELRYLFETQGKLYHSLIDDGQQFEYDPEKVLKRMEMISVSEDAITMSADEGSKQLSILFINDAGMWKVAGGSFFGIEAMPLAGTDNSIICVLALATILIDVVIVRYFFLKQSHL